MDGEREAGRYDHEPVPLRVVERRQDFAIDVERGHSVALHIKYIRKLQQKGGPDRFGKHFWAEALSGG